MHLFHTIIPQILSINLLLFAVQPPFSSPSWSSSNCPRVFPPPWPYPTVSMISLTNSQKALERSKRNYHGHYPWNEVLSDEISCWSRIQLAIMFGRELKKSMGILTGYPFSPTSPSFSPWPLLWEYPGGPSSYPYLPRTAPSSPSRVDSETDHHRTGGQTYDPLHSHTLALLTPLSFILLVVISREYVHSLPNTSHTTTQYHSTIETN